jgi:hypothetical protein
MNLNFEDYKKTGKSGSYDAKTDSYVLDDGPQEITEGEQLVQIDVNNAQPDSQETAQPDAMETVSTDRQETIKSTGSGVKP